MHFTRTERQRNLFLEREGREHPGGHWDESDSERSANRAAFFAGQARQALTRGDRVWEEHAGRVSLDKSCCLIFLGLFSVMLYNNLSHSSIMS